MAWIASSYSLVTARVAPSQTIRWLVEPLNRSIPPIETSLVTTYQFSEPAVPYVSPAAAFVSTMGSKHCCTSPFAST